MSASGLAEVLEVTSEGLDQAGQLTAVEGRLFSGEGEVTDVGGQLHTSGFCTARMAAISAAVKRTEMVTSGLWDDTGRG